jgi:hypothetical protein
MKTLFPAAINPQKKKTVVSVISAPWLVFLAACSVIFHRLIVQNSKKLPHMDGSFDEL